MPTTTKITVELKPLIYKLEHSEIGPLSRERLMELAEAELLRLLKEEQVTPKIGTIEIFNHDILLPAEVRVGLIVNTVHGETGIITSISKDRYESKPINVVLPGHRIIQFHSKELMYSSVPFNKARSPRPVFAREGGLWHEGDSGYLYSQKRDLYVPIVVGQVKRGECHVYPIYPDETLKPVYVFKTTEVRRFLTEFTKNDPMTDYESSEEVAKRLRAKDEEQCETKKELEVMS